MKLDSLSDAVLMQIELMRWESRFAFSAMGNIADDEEWGALKELLERNPEYVANAWRWLATSIENAETKSQIIAAWICGEAKDGEEAVRIYDEAMAQGWTPSRIRKELRANDGKERAPRGCHCDCAQCEKCKHRSKPKRGKGRSVDGADE